jgi:hypothetical protein
MRRKTGIFVFGDDKIPLICEGAVRYLEAKTVNCIHYASQICLVQAVVER